MDDMPHVILRAPLSEMCGGRSHTLAGTTVVEVLKTLETAYPAVTGWILDEQGLIREHINIFVNGERGREETRVDETDRVQVLPAISGG
jgi:molybdopterin synthase sulfur carrier subunit